jgi:hypothetical protein
MRWSELNSYVSKQGKVVTFVNMLTNHHESQGYLLPAERKLSPKNGHFTLGFVTLTQQ